MSRPIVRCDEIGINGRALFRQYVSKGELDSAEMVLDHWRGKCPITEDWQRSRILLLMAKPALVDTALPADFINDLGLYHYYSVIPKQTLWDKAPELAGNLAFTSAWSTELMKSFSPGMVEYGLAEFYGPNAEKLFPALQAGAYPGTKLQREYSALVDSTLKMTELHMAAFLGVWIPTGGITVLGAHPEIGFQGGIKRVRMNYDLTLAFRTGSAAETYMARRIHAADTLEPTSNYFGGHVSLDVGYDIIQRHRNEVQVVGGIGYDGFDAFKSGPKNTEANQSASAGSLDLSVGMGYRYYLNPNGYLGLQVKYHQVDYTTNNVVDFNGSPFTVRLIYGGVSNLRKQNQLDFIQYKLRR